MVRRIYGMFLDDGRTEGEIAHKLNGEGLATDRGLAWTRGTVRELLTNEKYVGQNVFNRVSFKLKVKRVHNPPEMWVRGADAFDPIVDPAAFHAIRGILLARHRRLSIDEMLGRLKTLLDEHGRISGALIDETELMPSAAAYRHRFGSLLQAYAKVGYAPACDYGFLETTRRLRTLYPELVNDVARALAATGARIERDPHADLITINGQLRVAIVLSRYELTAAGAPRWTIALDRDLDPALTIAVRMDDGNAAPLDYFVLPSLDVRAQRLRVGETNFIGIDAYRYDSLDFFVGMAEQVSVEVAA
jgi:hypothetical protein